jgi:hypothetical protein
MELADLNKIERTRRMKPGQRINIPMQWLKSKPIAVTVSHVAGQVSVQRDANSGFETLTMGQNLPVGAVVRTLEGETALGFADDSVLLVEANTILALDTVSNFEGKTIVDSSVRLQRGSVKAKVKSQGSRRFRIHTPAAVASVRGTEYRVSADSSGLAATRSEVFEGEIALANSIGAKNIEQGFASSVSENSAPIDPVKLLDPPELQLPATNVSLPYELRWGEQDGARAYRVTLHEAENEDAVLSRRIVSSPKLMVSELELGCYGLKLSAIDKNKFLGLPASGEICFVETVAAPEFVSPLYKHKDEIRWSSVSNAQEYIVQTSLDAEFSVLLSEETTKSNVIEVGHKQPVYLRVFAVGESGQRSDVSQTAIKQAQSKPWWIAGPAAALLLIAL